MPTECPAADGSSPRKTSFDGPPPMCIDPDKRYSWGSDSAQMAFITMRRPTRIAVHADTMIPPGVT